MAPLALARWVLVEHTRRPATWAVMALLGAAWPLALAFVDVGITTRDEPYSGHSYEIAFIAALYGTSSGVVTLGRSSWFLERAAPLRRLAAETGGLLGSTALPLVAALLPACFLAPGASGVATYIPALVLTVLHLVALGLIALRIPAPAASRAWLLPLLAWVAPALLAGLADRPPGAVRALANWAGSLLDAARHGRLGLELGGGMAHRWRELLPISALVVAAWLLASRRPSVHALRHPR